MLRLKIVFLLFGILFYSFSFAQENSLETEAKVALLNYLQESDRSSVETPEFQINSQSITAPSGIHHYYFIQTIQDIPVYKALAAVHLDKNGKAISINSKMIDQSSYQRSFGNQNFGALEATEIAVTSLGLVYSKEIATKNNNGMFVFDRKKNLHGPVLTEFMLLPFEEDLIPAWRIEVMDMDHHVKWQIWVSDRDGDVILKESLTHYCAFDIGDRKQNSEFNTERKSKEYSLENSVNFGPEATYQVLPFPIESPNHGDFEIIEEPWDLIASPYGWHDNNGFPGAETTSTSGNNVNTSLDRAGDGPSSNDEADGGAELMFVFPYDPEADPLDNAETAVTNMFYSINWMHDFSFKFGFDEVSGNFQEKNYSGEGSGNDPVVSVVQNGFEASPPSLNNASMATSSEGFPPFMENRLFDASFGGAAYLEITNPAVVADFYESTPASEFGADITSTPIVGEVIMIQDESSPVTDGCDEIVNGSEIAGKIAMIDRGDCEFGFKVLQAEEAGAIAVIVCNNQPTGLVSMGGGVYGGQVTIPSIFISQSDCQKIRIYAGDSLECIIKAPEGSTGPEYLDGAFDNGIVAHEFAHGISNRLTGGPGQTGCLNNYEQMGEGISDFFTLVSTVKPGDDGSQPKGIGTYVARQETDGLGIRRFQYTTDMSINPLTYDDIIGETSDAGIYAIGELWCSTLWDLYWLMSQAYGFDATYTDTSAGNYKTMMLVMEGMKLQTCDPGFIDSRDAILLADETMYNSENSCIIWEAFSRRGLGMNADQNDADNPNDGTEDFSIPISCTKQLRINKTTPDLIQPGEAFDIVLEVRNGLSATQNNVMVSDELLDGLDFVSSDISPEITGNELKWTIPTLQPDEEWSVSYSVQPSPSLSSGRAFIDSMENNDNWFPLINNGDDQFDLSDARPAGGNYSYHVPNTTLENDQQLLFLNEVMPGEHDWPVIRFDHYFDTEQGVDGGILEFSIDNASTWTDIGDRFINKPYTGRIDYSTFAIYKQQAFSGQSGDYQTSYIDISDFIGETVFLRFRFGSDEGHLKPDQYEGWYIDNFEIMDAKGFMSPACVISDESIQVCTDPDESITLIDSRIINSIKEETQSSTLLVFPNPASDQINISSEWVRAGNPVVILSTIDGERIYTRTGTVPSILSISTTDIVPGFYFLQIINNGISTTRKVIIGK